MDFELLGRPPDAPTLDLDHRRFAYAGKFVTPRTGKAVARASEDPRGPEIVAATAFDADRDSESTGRIRYVTVREDVRGEGVGPRLLRVTAEDLADRYEAVDIGVNNPRAYEACYKAGFVWTGAETGMAELRMRYAPDASRSAERYRDGYTVFAGRDLPDDQRAVVTAHASGNPPTVVDVPE